jgi:hypothetical protein
MFPIRIRPPLYIYEIINHGRLSSHLSNRQNTTNQYTTSLLPSFLLYFSSFFVGAAWTVDQRQRSSRAARLARAAYSRCTPRRGPSRVCGVLGLKIRRRRVLHIALPTRLLQQRVLRITLIVGGTRFRCGHP